MNDKQTTGIIRYHESFIAYGAPCIDMKLSELENKTGIICDHIHNSPPHYETRKASHADIQLKANMVLHVSGTTEQLRSFVYMINPA